MRGSKRPVRPRTREMPQLAEKRMVAYAETTPQVAVRYHSVPDGHVDEPALVFLGQILNGRTGRLYKSLVEQQQVANSASAGQAGYGFEGFFGLRGTAKPGTMPEDVERALYKELEKLQTEPVTHRELQKVKNQNAARNFRRLRFNFGLMLELLVRAAWRDWGTINTDPALYDAVTAEDIMRIANTYFAPENRAGRHLLSQIDDGCGRPAAGRPGRGRAAAGRADANHDGADGRRGAPSVHRPA